MIRLPLVTLRKRFLARYAPLVETASLAEGRAFVFRRRAAARAHRKMDSGSPGATTPNTLRKQPNIKPPIRIAHPYYKVNNTNLYMEKAPRNILNLILEKCPSKVEKGTKVLYSTVHYRS
jgi:hypothetical protein